jgi:HEAT repeat protein
MSMRGTARLVAASVLFFVSSAAPAQDAEALFREAIDLYERGRDTEALAKMREVLAADPGAELAWRLRATVEGREWARLLARGGEHAAVFQHFFSLALPAARAHAKDPEAIRALIARMEGGDWGDSQKALFQLAADHGEYAVPHLVTRLGSDSTETRAQAMEWLRRLGRQSVLPLIQVLDNPEPMIVANALTVLGQLRDARANPYLLLHASGSGPDLVRSAAQRALRDSGAASAMDPASALLELAEAYYRRDVAVVDPFRATYVAWGADGAALISREVPRDLYHLKLAEEVLFDVLALHADSMPAQVLLASTMLAQAEVAAGAPAEEPGAETLRRATELAWALGPQVLDATIRKALADGRPAVAAGAIRLLAAVASAELIPGLTGLQEAVTSAYKDVRYEAAITLAALGQAGNYPAASQVTAALCEALGQDAVRTVVVIDDREETRNRILADLNARGYFAYGTPSGSIGLAAVRDYPVEDLVIIRYDLQDATPHQVVKELKADPRTSSRPIAMIVEGGTATAARDAFGSSVAAFIEMPVAAEGYEPTLRGLLETTDEAREAATLVAVRAAAALAHLPPRGTGVTSGAAVSALAGALHGDDRVRIPALQALGLIGDPAGLAPAFAVLQDRTASDAVRGEAAVAVARISRSAGSASPEIAAVIAEAATGGSPGLQAMAARAAGLLPADAAARVALLGGMRPRVHVDMVE